MRVAIISDLHGFLPDLPDVVDLLIIAGDVCPVVDHRIERQRAWLRSDFIPWLDRQPAHRKIMVWGNHDFVGERDSLPAIHADILNNDSVVLDNGLCVWGTPLSGKFGKWAFMRSEESLSNTYVEIPDHADIVISHGPPKFYGDECQNGYHAGSPSLLDALANRVRPQLTVVGHIHEARGVYPTGWSTVVNASAVDLQYELRPDPYTYVYI